MSIKNTKRNAAAYLLDKICYMCEDTPRLKQSTSKNSELIPE